MATDPELPPTENQTRLAPGEKGGDCSPSLLLTEGIKAISLCDSVENFRQVVLASVGAVYDCPHWLYGEVLDPERPTEVEICAFMPSPYKDLFTGMRVPIAPSAFSHRLYVERRISYAGEDTGTLGELNPSFLETYPLVGFLGVPLLFDGKVVGGLFAPTFRGETAHVPSFAQSCALQNLALVGAMALHRLRIQDALQIEIVQRTESETRYKTLVEESLVGVYLIQNDRFAYANPALLAMFGYSEAELAQKTVADLVAPSDRELVLHNIQRRVSGEVQDVHYFFEGLHQTGRIFPVEAHGGRVASKSGPAVLGMILDRTAARLAQTQNDELQHQLFQSQKMESLGVLAGGIAHDFNNLLMGILGFAELAMDHVDPKSPAIPHLKAIEAAGQRATGLTRQLLDYAGKGQFHEEHLDLSLQVEGTANLLEVSIPKCVALQLDLASDLPMVKGDPVQVQQVVMNLIINAAESIEAKVGEGGVIRLRTAVENFDPGQALNLIEGTDLPAGPYVLLEVSDNGTGMDEDTLRHIFEPFFTTKFTGRGLGLSAILGIVRGHHGGLSITSETAVGSTFRVFFPAHCQP